jgi:hypothetical protein
VANRGPRRLRPEHAAQAHLSYLMILHRASCWTISPARHGLAPGALTQIDYTKVCAEEIDELRRWVRLRGRPDGSFSKQWGKCGADRV